MPNIKGGKKFKSRKKNEFTEQKQLIKKDSGEGQEYAQVINAKGNGRFELMCCDGGKERMGMVRGTMRKRVWIVRGDLVMICKWDGMTDDKKCSIVHKYSESDAKRLQKEGELPQNFKLNLDELDECSDGDDYFKGMPTDSDESSDEEFPAEENGETYIKDIKDIDIDDI